MGVGGWGMRRGKEGKGILIGEVEVLGGWGLWQRRSGNFEFCTKESIDSWLKTMRRYGQVDKWLGPRPAWRAKVG